mgnify:CR=1 FL=1
MSRNTPSPSAAPEGLELATLAGGCFWCIETALFEIKGVVDVESGYAGSEFAPATYENVCTGKTGLAEVVHILYDPALIDYANLLKIFFVLHDPTTLNQQGNDIGTQYRSVIFYFNTEQQQQAEQLIHRLEDDGLNIVTELSPAPTFYLAEAEHQNFYARNPSQGYCNFSIPPKLAKLSAKFQDLIKVEPLHN